MSTSAPLAPAEQKPAIPPIEIISNLSWLERMVKVTSMGQRWMGRKLSDNAFDQVAATTVGQCCGAYILTKDWKIGSGDCPFGAPFAPYYDIRTGYAIERIRADHAAGKFPSYREADMLAIYRDEWWKKHILRDKTFLLFVEGRTHEEVIEYVHTEDFRKTHQIHGITFNDKDDGLMSAVWVDA